MMMTTEVLKCTNKNHISVKPTDPITTTNTTANIIITITFITTTNTITTANTTTEADANEDAGVNPLYNPLRLYIWEYIFVTAKTRG